MSKITMGPQAHVYPMPAILVGSVVDGRPNFMAVGSHGIASMDPAMVSVAIRPQRYSLSGIRQNMAFSINVPSVSAVAETDYCGIVSGSNSDKAGTCRFTVFYGSTNGAPLIEQCPLNMECKVAHLLDLGSHVLVIGRVQETHVSEDCLTDGKLDMDKVKPFFYVTTPSKRYQSLGDTIAKAYSIGISLKQAC